MTPNSRTELAKWRTYAAAERTLLAWIRGTSVLLGAGLATSYLSGYLSDPFVHPFEQSFSGANHEIDLALLHAIGLLSIASAMMLLALAAWQYSIIIRSLRQPDYILLSSSTMEKASAIAVVIYGLAAICILSLRLI